MKLTRGTSSSVRSFLRSTPVLLLAAFACGDDPVQPVQPPSAPLPASVTVTATATQLSSFGDSALFTAVVKDSSGNVMQNATVQWVSDNTAAVVINESGTAVAVGNGSSTIRAVALPAMGQAEITVSQVAASIDVTPAAISFRSLNDTTRLRAVLRDARGTEIAGGYEIQWSSLNPSVATVQSTQGLTRAVNIGQTRIAVVAGGLTDTVDVNVSQVPVGFSMLPLPQAVPGSLITPRIGIVDALGNFIEGATASFELFTLDNSIATVTADQRIRALRTGRVLVRARFASGFVDRTLLVRETLGGTLDDVLEIPEAMTLHVTSELAIGGTGRLVLAPGTRLLFDGKFGITVAGVLIAQGTASDSIRFLSSQPSPAAGDWAGIRIVNGATVLDSTGSYVSGTIISRAVVTHGGGIWVDGGRAAILNSRIQHNAPIRTNAPYGAVAVAGSSVTVRDNVISDNAATGVRVYGGAARVQRNRITGNTGGYLGSWHGGGMTIVATTAQVEDNRIIGNTSEFMGGGILLGETSNATIRYNDILDNVLTGPPNNGSAIGKNFFATNATVEFNNIEGNRCTASGECAAIFLTAGFQGSIRNNNIVNQGAFELLMHLGALGGTIGASSNYWGTTSTSTIDARIWDRTDNANLAVVEYTPPLAARMSGTGPRP